MKVKIKRVNKKFPLPVYQKDAACFDLFCRETIVIEPNTISLVPSNVVIKVPFRHALLVFARSSTPLRKGLVLANGVGVVDPFFEKDNDEILVQFLNISDHKIRIEAGDRLAQGMIIKTPPVSWQEVSKMENPGGGYWTKKRNKKPGDF